MSYVLGGGLTGEVPHFRILLVYRRDLFVGKSSPASPTEDGEHLLYDPRRAGLRVGKGRDTALKLIRALM